MRILIKLSGELLAGEGGARRYPINDSVVYSIAEAIHRTWQERQMDLAISVGGGNIFRGRSASGLMKLRLSTVSADYMGLLGTVINGRALLDVFRSLGATPVLFSDVVDERIAQRFDADPQTVKRLFSDRKILIFSGTGDPGDGITSDTVAALKAIQLQCDVLLKATKTDAVYDRPPEESGARAFSSISYDDLVAMRSGVIDEEAVIKCRRANIPIRVFRFGADRLDNFTLAMDGKIGTLISLNASRHAGT